MIVVSQERLRDLTVRLLSALDIPAEDASLGADVLLASDLRGIDSHGVSRLELYYHRMTKDLINPVPTPTIIRDSGSVVVLDADNGLGICTAPKAMRLCIERAKEHCMAAVATRNTNHFGIAGYYALMAAEQDMVGLVVANTTPFMAPFGGRERLLGTNPIAIGVPGGQFPIVLDMATSAVAVGKLQVALRKGEKIPLGWLVDAEGKPTQDPIALLKDGSLVPMAGPKGYGLAVMVDILAALLAGAAVGPDIGSLVLGDRPEHIGHFMLALDVGRFKAIAEFKNAVDNYIKMIKDSKPAEGVNEVFLPGEIEMLKTKERMAKGIPLSSTVARTLLRISRTLGIAGESDTFEDLVRDDNSLD